MHHDADILPDGNVLLLLHDDMFLPEDLGERRRGDRLVVLDRHTLDEVWSWRTIDHFSTGAGHPDPARWTHCNTAFYHAPHDSVYISSRHFSRITRIDFGTGDIVFNMGKRAGMLAGARRAESFTPHV